MRKKRKNKPKVWTWDDPKRVGKKVGETKGKKNKKTMVKFNNSNYTEKISDAELNRALE